jgi:hypothetical protein
MSTTEITVTDTDEGTEMTELCPPSLHTLSLYDSVNFLQNQVCFLEKLDFNYILKSYYYFRLL